MKRFLCLFAALLCLNMLSAQSSYVKLYAGYAFETAKSAFNSPLEEQVGNSLLTISGSSYSEVNSLGTLGAGINVGTGFGYMFNDHVGLELSVYYINGKQVTDSKIQTDTYSASQMSKAWNLRVYPSLVVSAGTFNKVSPYARFGLAIPIAGKVKTDIAADDKEGRIFGLLTGAPCPDCETTLSAVAKTSGSFSLGFTGAFGVDYNISDRLGIFGEIETTMINVKIKETVTEEVEGSTLHPTFGTIPINFDILPDYLELTNYVDELTETSNNQDSNPNFNPMLPLEELEFRNNFNSFAINIGIKYRFGK